MSSELLAVVRAVLYTMLMLLLVFDIPVVKSGHRGVLLAMIFWIGMLLGASLTFSVGLLEPWLWFRDVGLTVSLILVVAAHIIWMAGRGGGKQGG